MPKASSTSSAASPADAALEQVREVCYRFAGTEEKLSHGAPSFHVRGKHFVTFVDNHHADGMLAAWCKASHERQKELVATRPDRYFVPPYVGVRGWVGVRLDAPAMRPGDWVELAIVIEEGWVAVAPPRLARGEGVATGAPRPKPPERGRTDAAVARAGLERLTAICLALPGATCERENQHATFRVGTKVFCYFLDNHHGDGIVAACVRTARGENEALAEEDPKRFYLPAYIGSRGWVGVRVDGRRVDWKDIAARAEASYRGVAPKRGGAARPAAKRRATVRT